MSYRYTLECDYCGHIWTKLFFMDPEDSHLECEKCKDKNVQVHKHKKIDYYAGKKK